MSNLYTFESLSATNNGFVVSFDFLTSVYNLHGKIEIIKNLRNNFDGMQFKPDLKMANAIVERFLLDIPVITHENIEELKTGRIDPVGSNGENPILYEFIVINEKLYISFTCKMSANYSNDLKNAYICSRLAKYGAVVHTNATYEFSKKGLFALMNNLAEANAIVKMFEVDTVYKDVLIDMFEMLRTIKWSTLKDLFDEVDTILVHMIGNNVMIKDYDNQSKVGLVLSIFN
jgi:hypothetical protein